MHGNCLIMIYGTQLEVEALVHANLNKNFTRYDAVMAVDPETDVMTPVFPDSLSKSVIVDDVRVKVKANLHA